MTDTEIYENNLRHFQVIRRRGDSAQCRCPSHPDKQAYGFTKSEIEEQMKDGIMNQGFSVSMSYNGLRLALAHITGEHEYFSIEDIWNCLIRA